MDAKCAKWAEEIRADWKNVNYAAKPYLSAMACISGGRYYMDTWDSIVLYFLCNAQGWRGEVAKRVKAEMKAALKKGGV